MPGRPRTRAMIARLDELTRAAFPDQPDATHLEYVEHWLASGHTLNALADALTTPATATTPPEQANDAESVAYARGRDLQSRDSQASADAPALPVSGDMVMRYLNATFGADLVRERITRARESGAHRLADQTISIADAARTKEEIAAARLRVSARQWTASHWNTTEYGQTAQTNVSISLTQLHLQALMQAGNRVTGAPENAIASAIGPRISERSNGQVVVTPLLTDDA